MLENVKVGGGTWQERGVTADEVLTKVALIEDGSAQARPVRQGPDRAGRQGWHSGASPGQPVTVRSPERRAVGVVFLLFGADTGTFASRLPWIADRLHLTSGMLGLSVGLMMAVGAVVTIPFAARLVHRYGPRASTRLLITATGAMLALPAFAPNVLVLSAVMLATGAVYGTCDNAVNAQGVEAERRIGRSIMSGLHGMWSLGVLAGALIGSLAAREHVDPRVQFAVMGAVIAVGGIAATSWFVSTPATAGGAGADRRPAVRLAARHYLADRASGLRRHLCRDSWK